MKHIFVLLILATAASADKIIAVLEIIPKSDDVEMSVSEFRHLTDELRTRARESLQGDYTILTRDNIMQLLPPDEDEMECLAESCAIEIGRAIGAEYVTQGFVGKFGNMMTLNVEFYESMSGNMLGSFVTESEDIMGLLSAMRQKAPDLFAKMPKSVQQEIKISMPEPEPVPEPESEPEPVASLPISGIQPQAATGSNSAKTSTWIAVGLDVLGIAAIGFGVWQNSEAAKLHKDYNALSGNGPDYKNAGEKVENAVTKRNVAYIVGGVLLAAGIGVHIWF